MITKAWKDPVWSKVIATGILAIIGGVCAYFLNWWPSIKSSFIALFSFLGASTEITNWLIGLMGICTAIIAFVILAILWNLIFPNTISSNWRNYVSDNFFSLEWHWRYSSDGSICNLFSCCSNCHYQVYPVDVSSFRAVPRIAFECDSCGSTAGPFEGTELDLDNKVKRFIQQKLRTGNCPTNEKA